jgi:hypothetical protein
LTVSSVVPEVVPTMKTARLFTLVCFAAMLLGLAAAAWA